MAHYSLLHPLSSVCFESKTHFSASQDVSLARSKYFKLPETERPGNAWGIKPPDFSLRQYRSLSVPQNKRRKFNLNLPASQPSETRQNAGRNLQSLLRDSIRRKDPPKFISSYRPPGDLESELMFVKSGKYPCERYKNPRPHNFRPLDETLPDIVTTYDKDPGNLDMKLKHLDTLRTNNADPDFSLRKSKAQMDTHKPAKPHWDASLILPQLPWPPKSASYTRHRRRRGAYSAFLDRVEEKLSRSWKNRS